MLVCCDTEQTTIVAGAECRLSTEHLGQKFTFISIVHRTQPTRNLLHISLTTFETEVSE